MTLFELRQKWQSKTDKVILLDSPLYQILATILMARRNGWNPRNLQEIYLETPYSGQIPKGMFYEILTNPELIEENL